MRPPNRIMMKPPSYLVQGFYETDAEFELRKRQACIPLSPHGFTLAEARRLHKWFGRLVKYLEKRQRG